MILQLILMKNIVILKIILKYFILFFIFLVTQPITSTSSFTKSSNTHVTLSTTLPLDTSTQEYGTLSSSSVTSLKPSASTTETNIITQSTALTYESSETTGTKSSITTSKAITSTVSRSSIKTESITINEHKSTTIKITEDTTSKDDLDPNTSSSSASVGTILGYSIGATIVLIAIVVVSIYFYLKKTKLTKVGATDPENNVEEHSF
jgi:hypothetical protein